MAVPDGELRIDKEVKGSRVDRVRRGAGGRRGAASARYSPQAPAGHRAGAREQLQHLSMGEPAGAPRLVLGLLGELSHIHERGLAARSSRWIYEGAGGGQMRCAGARRGRSRRCEYKLP